MPKMPKGNAVEGPVKAGPVKNVQQVKVPKTGGFGKGLIDSGNDKHSYLGHFRSPDSIMKGHNQGAPGEQNPITIAPTGQNVPPPSAVSSPVVKPLGTMSRSQNPEGGQQPLAPPAPTRQAMPGAATGSQTLMQGAVSGPAKPIAPPARSGIDHPALNPISNPQGFAEAHGFGTPTALSARPQAGYLGAARQAGRAGIKAARKGTSGMTVPQARAGAQAGMVGARQQRQAAIGEAKGNLQSATDAVRQARQATRSAIRGGDVKGAESARGQLTAAKGERKAAKKTRQSLRLK